MTERLLTIWVIYNNPSDHPGKWVLRGQDAVRGGGVQPRQECFVCESLKQARDHLPRGVVHLSRCPDDDPAIYETWI